MSTESVECSICFVMMVEPIRIKCGHLYCLTCVERLALSPSPCCPMDRKTFDVENDLKFDLGVQKANMIANRGEFDEIATGVVNYRLSKSHCTEMSLTFGNSHTLLPTDDDNRHKWTAFVSVQKLENRIENILNGLRSDAGLESLLNLEEASMKTRHAYNSINFDNISAEKVVKRVTFKLHPSFTPNNIDIERGPYKLTRIGWAECNVSMIVEFHDYLNIESMELDHYLSFKNNLSQSSKKIYVDVQKALLFGQ